jgi:hypothetical protein
MQLAREIDLNNFHVVSIICSRGYSESVRTEMKVSEQLLAQAL